MDSFKVSLYLTGLLSVFYILIRQYLGKNTSITVIIVLLFLMVTPGFLIDLQNVYFWGEVGIHNLTLFLGLLILTTIPWISFDKWYSKYGSIAVTDKGAAILSSVFKVVIFSCVLSYIYIAPYAIKSFAIGAADIRGQLGDISVLPNSIVTTFAVAISTISPFYIFFFFLSWLHPRLRRYSKWLFFCSFIYIVVSMPFMARDGFVVLPVFFMIFYLLFRKSLSQADHKKVKKYFTVVVVLAGALLLVYSISRFYEKSSTSASEEFLSGTWGYLFQQPYVFDRTITLQEHWHGYNLRFPILSFLDNSAPMEVVRDQDFETMFGTMLSEFYSIGGYWSLYVFTFGFIFIYYIGLKINIMNRNIFAIFMFFITYLMIEVTGLFYFRYGGISFNYLFLFLTILPIFLPRNILTIKK